MAHFRKDILSFVLGTRCNFNCSYCLADDIKQGDQTIDLEFAKKGIDDFFDSRESRKIRFYAMGEPTLYMKEIEKIYNYAKEKAGEQLSVELQTNGAFSKSVREWIAENVDRIWISLDGPSDVQDSQRKTIGGKSARAVIEENIIRLLKVDGLMVGARPTVTNANLHRQVEMIDYYHSLGLTNIWSHHEFSAVGKDKPIQHQSVAKIDLLEYAIEAVRAVKRAEELGMFYRPFLAASFDEPCMYSCRACLPGWHLTFDGYVSACDMAFHGNTPLQDFIWGRWDAEKKVIVYDKEKIAKLKSRTWEKIDDCVECNIAENCAGGCLGEAYFETGSMFGTRKDHCKAVRYLAEHLPRNQGRYKFEHP